MAIRAGFSSKRATIIRAGRIVRSRPAAESTHATTASSLLSATGPDCGAERAADAPPWLDLGQRAEGPAGGFGHPDLGAAPLAPVEVGLDLGPLGRGQGVVDQSRQQLVGMSGRGGTVVVAYSGNRSFDGSGTAE